MNGSSREDQGLQSPISDGPSTGSNGDSSVRSVSQESSHTGDSPSPAPVSPEINRRLGVNYDTNWTRRPLPSALRDLTFSLLIGPLARFICSPTTTGLAHLEGVDEPVIFAPNHVSHFDTLALLCVLPARFRRRTVVAAAVDNFFDRHWKCTLYSLFLGTIPVDRLRINRKSADIAADLLDQGFNLLIFPEGGRSLREEMMEFRPGAAYLAKRCGRPVIPVYLEGVSAVMPKGESGVHRAAIGVHFGELLRPFSASITGGKEEDARRFTRRIQAGVAALGAKMPTEN